jgi:hypothetical protein
MTKHYNVLIATPGHSLMAQYVKSLIATTDVLNEKGITWAFCNKYASHVGDAREITIGGEDPQDANDSRPFKGEFTYDKIIWIDSDIAWTPEDFLKLYESDKDIISGAYLLANGQVVAYKELFKSPLGYIEVLNMKEPIKVHGIGFGFVAVKQGIFESLTRPWFQQAVATMQREDGTEYQFPVMGEDISWCERVKAQGYEIWFDPEVRVTHHKMMTLSWEGIQP